MVGCCVARLLARFPAVEVTLVDVDTSRADVAAALGVGFARPEDAAGGCDLVVHTSATSAGLQRSLELLAPEATVLDLSWYGDDEVRLSLAARSTPGGWACGRARSGPCPPARSGRRSTGDRLALALETAARPSVRCGGERRVALRGPPRRHGAAGSREPARAVPHDHVRRG
jgi:hypothetical protein